MVRNAVTSLARESGARSSAGAPGSAAGSKAERIVIRNGSAAERLGLQGWVLFPTREETVAAISHSRDRLRGIYRVPTPTWETVHRAWDKRETYALAQQLGVDAPRCWFPRSEEDLALVPTGAPVVIKPAIKEHFFYATKAKAWRVDTRAELVAAYRRATEITGPGEIIVQELVPGGGDRQMAYCALFRDGDAVAEMTVLRRRQHPSDFGRASTRATSPRSSSSLTPPRAARASPGSLERKRPEITMEKG